MWLVNLFLVFGASCGCLHRGRLGVVSRTATLFLWFGGVWVDVKICFVLGCVAWLPASREARLGRRISDRVIASKVWGCVGGC